MAVKDTLLVSNTRLTRHTPAFVASTDAAARAASRTGRVSISVSPKHLDNCKWRDLGFSSE